jgi:hypothetical protein
MSGMVAWRHWRPLARYRRSTSRLALGSIGGGNGRDRSLASLARGNRPRSSGSRRPWCATVCRRSNIPDGLQVFGARTWRLKAWENPWRKSGHGLGPEQQTTAADGGC